MRTLGLLAGAALVLAACGGGQPQPLTISDVNVQTDLTAVGSPQAVDYGQSLSGDLETAIANQFVGRIDPAGNTINVDIDELSLTSAFTAGATAETTQLSGQVEVLNPAGTSEGVWNVTATAQDVVDYFPPGTNLVSVPPTSAAYYQAIVTAFARGTALAIQTGEAS
jgi:hypothetical protein